MSLDPRYVIDDPKVTYRGFDGWHDAYTGAFTPVGWPTAANTGVYAADPDWTPAFTVTDNNFEILTPGTVIEDLRLVNGSLLVSAPHVTIRRAELINATIANEYHGAVQNGLVIEDVSMTSDPPGKWMQTIFNTAILTAGYTCRRVSIVDTNEGVHTGGSQLPLADPDDPLGWTVRLYNCYTDVVGPVSASTGTYCQVDAAAAAADPTHPTVGSWLDWHGDCCQAEDAGSGGVPIKARNCSFKARDMTNNPAFGCGASAIWYTRPTQSQPPDVDGLIVDGAGFSIHNGVGGKWRNVHIIKDHWIFGPLSFETWDTIEVWDDCFISTLDGAGNPVPYGRIPFGYPGFGPLAPV